MCGLAFGRLHVLCMSGLAEVQRNVYVRHDHLIAEMVRPVAEPVEVTSQEQRLLV